MVSISKTTREKTPSFPYQKIKDKVLGKKYDLSLVFVGKSRIHSLNQSYRQLDKPTDVLSFPLDKQTGEIFICLEVAKRKASEFGLPPKQFVGYIFIHGLLHLKGLTHGSKMNEAEVNLCRAFNISEPHNK